MNIFTPVTMFQIILKSDGTHRKFCRFLMNVRANFFFNNEQSATLKRSLGL
jgi:hypothetical protein